MSIRVPEKPSAEVTRVLFKLDSTKSVIRVYHSFKGNVRLLWELVTGYIFTKDGLSLKTKDDFIIKCKDQ